MGTQTQFVLKWGGGMLQTTNPFLLAMIPVRNEAKRYLSTVLKNISSLVSGIVILDDASTDDTPTLCRSHPRVIRYHRLAKPLFLRDEAAFRSMLWGMTMELNPTWVLALDADEYPESKLKKEFIEKTAKSLIRLPVCHFWGSLEHYRIDGMWNPLLYPTACLFRPKKDRVYHWAQRRLHCGRFPVEAYENPSVTTKVRLLHFGYADRGEHWGKYDRYIQADPEGVFCPQEHYASILDPHPVLKKWTGERLEVTR